LKLIDALVDPNEARFGDEDLRAIIDRLRAADPQIAKIAAFRAWNDRLRAQQV
jgi:hypothetical protein